MHAVVLKYLEEVARRGSIRKASRALNVASSAINRQILKLEEEIGTPLFQRLPAGMRLTPAGELVLRHVRGTMYDFSRMRSEIAALQGVTAGLVTIASLDSLLVDFLPRAVESFHRKHPAVTYRIDARGPGDVAALVAAGSADLGLSFSLDGHADVTFAEEVATPLGVIMPPQHPLAGRPVLTLAECGGYPMIFQEDTQPIRSLLEAELAATKAAATPILTSNTQTLIKRMVRAGLGIAFYTKLAFLDEIARGKLVHVPLADHSLANLRLGLVVPKYRQPAVAAALLIEHLGKCLRDLAV